jgi:hypothetical protein
MAGEAALALLASQAVPEPKSSLLLIVTALLLASTFSRRRRAPEPRPSLPPIAV